MPAASPLGILLFIAAIYLIVISPKKLKTLVRVLIGLVGTALLIMIPTSLLRIGDPQAWGQIVAVVAPLVAVIVGWLHTRSLKRRAA